MWQIRPDDLSSPAVHDLLAAHLAHMHSQTPAESVHALGLEQLQGADTAVYTAWDGPSLAGMGALVRLNANDGEIKSMRTADAARGKGAGRALLRHLIDAASAQGMTDLWLETGVEDGFVAARNLYLSEGFVECDPFGSYTDDPLSVFMTRRLG